MADGFTMDNNNNNNIPPIGGQQAGPIPEPPSSFGAPPTPSPQQTQQQTMLGAVEAHFVAVRAKSIANLNGYMLSQAGVAEHPDIVSEIIKLIEAIDHAEGILNTLKRITT